MIYDDGTYDVTDAGGGSYAFNANGSVASYVDPSGGFFATDTREAAKIAPFYPQNGSSWYENLAQYGATRAIDAHFSQPPVDKTATGATYAGQNGRTYAGGLVQPGMGNGLLLIGLAALAYFALS